MRRLGRDDMLAALAGAFRCHRRCSLEERNTHGHLWRTVDHYVREANHRRYVSAAQTTPGDHHETTNGDVMMNHPNPLRAITLHPWWAYAITHGDKRIEYRTRPLPPRLVDVPIALHAGAATPADRRGTWSASSRPKIRSTDYGVARGWMSIVVVRRRCRVQRHSPFADLLPMRWRLCRVRRLAGPRRVPPPALAGRWQAGFWTCTDEQRDAIARSLVTP